MKILLQNPRPKPTSLDWLLLSPSSSMPEFHDNSRQCPTGGVLQQNQVKGKDSLARAVAFLDLYPFALTLLMFES